jgi:DNA mismatch repair ATPase MutS
VPDPRLTLAQAGKSTYLKQVAVICILAHIGTPLRPCAARC